MNYQESIAFLFSQLPMYQKKGAAAYKEDIGNIIALCEALDQPQENFKSIHVGGTNGKGSVSKILHSVFMEAGFKVGLYTSPHYLDFRERIQINGQMIPKEDVISFVHKMQQDVKEIQPSFFEMTVAMAFDYFSQEKVDIAIIEVGLGGRLDSTNIIHPELSIITNIGFDHQKFLGDTLEQIAFEKAGIIKPKTPIVIGRTQKETKGVFAMKANENRSPLLFADQAYELQKEGNLLSLTNRKTELVTKIYDAPNGSYQSENLRTAFTAFQTLKEDWNLSFQDFQNGVSQIEKNSPLIGRWQVIQELPMVIADSCHNLDGISTFLQDIQKLEYQQLHIIYGTVSDKNIAEFIPLFPTSATLYLTEPSIPRAMKVEDVQSHFSQFPDVSTFSNIVTAYEKALSQAKDEDLIIVMGSIFLVADLLDFLYICD